MQAFQEYFVNILKSKFYMPDGRARRKEYWMFTLFVFIAYIVLMVVATIFSAISETLGMLFLIVLFLFMLGIMVPGITLTIRRLHDIGKSGWWFLISFIPFGSIVLLVFACMDSQPGENMYGPNPKGM